MIFNTNPKTAPPGETIAGLRRCTRRGLVAGLALFCFGGSRAVQGETDPTDHPPFRVAMSARMFGEINANDAKASIKAWVETVAKESDIATDPDPGILNGAAEIASALRSNLVDAASMTANEFADVSLEIPLAPIFVAVMGGRISEEYVLLARHDGDIQRVRDLGGRSLVLFQNPRTSLAGVWLDTLLLREGLKPAMEYCGQITQAAKLSKVVLPVFFRQSDACLVTRRGFATMSELNPQVAKQLKVVAFSTEVVPTVFCFRSNFNSPAKTRIFATLLDLHKTPAGQQVLTVFQSDRLEERPVACLDGALQLLKDYRHFMETSVGRGSNTPPAISTK